MAATIFRDHFRLAVPLSICGVMLAALISCGEKPAETVAAMPEVVDFNFHIKPILVQKCYLCHGPDPSSREADLRLDIFEGATAKLESGYQAIVPGKPGKSHLLERITHHDEELRMPPASINQQVTDAEVALIKLWIEQGAEYKPHWAFVAPDRSIAGKLASYTQTQGIDLLLDEKIKSAGLEVAGRADNVALIRRLSYVLTGLPPKTEELALAQSDNFDAVYNQLVENYLSSPAFGERWARHWMDVVRYAETRGHEFDYTIQGAWIYRDYLIRAFNADLPYDQLLREHIAGDLLSNPRRDKDRVNESILGTLFYTLGEGTHSPVDTRKDESDRIDNMIDVTTKAFQALTVACAKCHDHKFDPIPTADYYAMYGVLEGTRFTPQPAIQSEVSQISLREAQKLQTYIREQIGSTLQEERTPVQLTSSNTVSATTTGSSSVTVLGDFRGQELDGWRSDGFAFGPKTTLGNIQVDATGKRILGLTEGMASSKYFGAGKFGVLRSPDFVVESQYIGVKARGNQGTVRIVMDNFQLIQYPIYGHMSQSVRSEGWKELVFDVGQWKGHKAYVEILPGYFHQHNYVQGSDDYVEVEYAIAYDDKWEAPPLVAHGQPASLAAAVSRWTSLEASTEDITLISKQLQQRAGSLKGLEKLIRQWQDLTESVRDTVFFSGVTDGFARESPVFIRGNHLELSEEKIPRRFLPEITRSSTAFESGGSGRLEMADAMLSPENPLTARVMVNRVWHHVFGRGIVETVDNFGLQGKLPSHPELLDYLAITFEQQGWSVKELIRAMVTTEAFKRAYSASEPTMSKDPDNLYLARYPVRRLEAEAIRDGLLAVSGNLDATMYGAPVPVHLTGFMQGRGRPRVNGPLDGEGRRSVYIEVRRNFINHILQTFDFPTPFTTFGKRDITNVPAQSLMLMNDPFVVHQASFWANRLITEGDMDISARVMRIYREAFGRDASQEEVVQATELIRNWSNREGIDNEAEILAHVPTWESFCHSVFNLKEFIYLM